MEAIPLTEDQHLLVRLGEECNEICQRISKLLTYGPAEQENARELTNMSRLEMEIIDFQAVLEMCISRDMFQVIAGGSEGLERIKLRKKMKVQDYMGYCHKIGMLRR